MTFQGSIFRSSVLPSAYAGTGGGGTNTITTITNNFIKEYADNTAYAAGELVIDSGAMWKARVAIGAANTLNPFDNIASWEWKEGKPNVASVPGTATADHPPEIRSIADEELYKLTTVGTSYHYQQV